MDADSVARELYALRPDEFVAARDARSAEARRAGDRDLASTIKAMRRPTASAWVVNLLARERGEQLERLLSLGAALREAQAKLSADELRRLGDQRRQVIGALAADGARCAATAGQPVGSQVVADVEQTLQAAVADAGAAEQVRSGRLTGALSYTGFGDVTISEAASSKGASRQSGSRKGRSRKGAPRKSTSRKKASQESASRPSDAQREQTRKALADAERTLAGATGAADQARRRVQDARAQRDEHANAVEDLERRLADVRSELATAERQVKDAQHTLGQAEAEVDDARRAVDAARAEAGEG